MFSAESEYYISITPQLLYQQKAAYSPTEADIHDI